MVRIRMAGAAWALLALLLPPPVEGQVRPGWIGVSVDIVETQAAGGRSTTVRVSDVQPGSPAALAGVRAGDTLLEVNDLVGADQLRGLASRLRLSAGDTVRVVYLRGGVAREVRLAAAERPAVLAPPAPGVTFGFEQDSMVASIVRAMDSLRVRLGSHAEHEILRIRGEDAPSLPDGTRRMVIVSPAPMPDPEALARAREAAAGALVDVSGAFSPLQPYVLGRNRVAGAEVVDLRPELAGYFGVQAGVLVVDVPGRTPAAAATLRGGDVIVAVGTEEVRSVDGLRVLVARAAGTASTAPIPLWVVRQGTRVRVDLPR